MLYLWYGQIYCKTYFNFSLFFQIDRNSDGFKNHIKRDHHLWNYLFYMYSIKISDETELNGIDSYVYDKVINFLNYQLILLDVKSK